MAAGAKRVKLTSAKERHGELMEYYRQLTLEKLSKPKHATWIPKMDGPGRSVHMGRALTKRLIDFISKERGIGAPAPQELVIGENAASFDFFQSDCEYGFSFITGSPGAGKTWSLRASVLYLYGKFAEERAKGGTSRMKRILFLEGEDFEILPMLALRRALFQAYSDDEAALRELESMQTLTPDALDDFMIESKEHLIIVVDDGNRVKCHGNAHNLLCLLRRYCPVIFCGSVSSEWIDVMRHPKASDYELVVGGLNDEELACFLKRFNVTRINLHETGTIPRLIQLYNQGTAVFEDTVGQLERGFDRFLVKALQEPDAELLRGQLARSLAVDRLTSFLESRCFYRGQDGFLKCLTGRLLDYAKTTISERLDLQDLDSKRKELAIWMEPILRDELRSHIGLNAEMAAILAMKFFTSNIYYEKDKCVQLNVRHVRGFKGQMSRSVLEAEPDATEGGTLFVPRSGRHAGIDVYYRDGEFLIAVQISVQKNAEHHHHNKVEKAEEVFHGEKREKVLLWVIDTDGWCSYNTSNRDYHYVTMPFSCLSIQLAKIDERLKALRCPNKKILDVCWACHNDAGDDDWVQCDLCDSWYHQRCVADDRKAQTCLRRTTAKTGDPEYIFTSADPFECRGCRDHIGLLT